MQEDVDDIIDEVLGFFKANVLFKHFEVKGHADRTLIYLTLYVTQCLIRLEKCPDQMEGLKALTAMAHEQFIIPGDPGFALGSFFPAPASAQESGAFSCFLHRHLCTFQSLHRLPAPTLIGSHSPLSLRPLQSSAAAT